MIGKKIGVVLAGGESRRFGEPKAFTEHKGKAMYQWAMEALHPSVEQTVIISHPKLVQRFQQESNLPVYEDDYQYKGLGPLAGIYTAMKMEKAEWYYVIPCDTPLITGDVYTFLWAHLNKNKKTGIIPIINGRLQPLISIYHRNLLTIIDELLTQKQLKMTGLLDKARIDTIETNGFFSESLFVNVNTKSELYSLEHNG